MMLRRSLLIAIAFLLVAVGGYAVYWKLAADQAEQAVDRWIADWRQAGFRIETEARDLGGFPGIITYDLTRPDLEDPDGFWRVRGERVRFEVRPWAPGDYRVELFGKTHLTAPVQGRPTDFTFDSARAVGGAEIGLDGTLKRLSLTFDELSVESPALEIAGGARRLAATLDLPPEPPADAAGAAADLTLTGDGVLLPAPHAGPLGREVDRVSTRMRVMGPVPQAGLRRALSLWRDRGGVLETPWLRIGWGPLGLDAEGALSLDGALRPEGAYQTRISGFEGTIDRFRDAGLIDPTAARLLAGGARLFSRAGDDGRAYIEMPVRAEGGALFVGPIQVAQLSPVVPPDGAAAATPPPVEAAPNPGAVQVEDLPAIQDPPTVSEGFPEGGE